jgi:cytochrome P450
MTSTAGVGARPAGQVPVWPANGFRVLRELRRDPLTLFTQVRREHGMISRLRVPRVPFYLVSDPAAIQDALTGTNRAFAKGLPGREGPAGPGVQPLARLLGEGLLTAPPQLHREQRRLMQPLFHRDRIAEYGATFAGLAEELAGQWSDGDHREIHRDMTELTLAIIARTVFDVDLDTQVANAIRAALDSGNQNVLRRSTSPLGRLLDRLPLPANRRFAATRATLDAVVYQLIADRRAAGAQGRDVLSLLISTRDAETGQAMSDQQIRDEAITLLLAGHETTANALAWSLHLLGAHPDVQHRLHAELDDVLDGRLPGAEDMTRLTYTSAVLHEAMRLYPPAWVMARRLVEEHDVAGYRLAAGSMLLLSPWAVHRDPQWWPDPDRFAPDRWLDPAAEQRPRYAYFPFGGGPRQCIGNSFAEMEGVLVLATLCRRWSFSPTPGAPPVTPRPLVTLRPSPGVAMTVRGR